MSKREPLKVHRLKLKDLQQEARLKESRKLPITRAKLRHKKELALINVV